MVIYDSKNQNYNYKHLEDKTKIRLLKEIKNIFSSEDVLDDEYIACSDLAIIVRSENRKYNECKHSFDKIITQTVHQKFDDSTNVYVCDFDYNENNLIVRFEYNGKHYIIKFIKDNGDLIVKESETLFGLDILNILGNYLSILYDQFMNFNNFGPKSYSCIKPINSNFNVSISDYGVSIVDGSMLSGVLEISAKSSSNNYSSLCNSNEIMNALRGREEEIFKRVKVKISDCPIWCQQLIEEEKNAKKEEERIRMETENKQNQKRKELIKKIFPFMKK